MRKETSNQFTKGLLSDLNPINTPNTVLTDNLNGTIITYNGNEHSLQNDMGNYELKHCKLNPNYIPVGIKEYGDILYITSYNPLDNSVEVGSYPSPLLITETKDKSYDTSVNSIITPLLSMPIHEGKYTELMEKADSLIFNGEDFKLNPGDQYCLQKDISDLKKYETIDYYVLGEDSSIHNVNDIIKTDELSTDTDYEHVPWTIPGWINLKVRLAELSTSGINVKHFYVPNDEDGKRVANFSLSLRLNINDPLLLQKQNEELSILEQWCENPDEIGFKVRILVNDVEKINTKFSLYEEQNEFLTLGKFEWSDWYENSRILWKTIEGQIPNLAKTDIIKIETIPFIVDKKEGYSIIYDNLIKELTFDLSSINNVPWTIGDDLYQFYLNDNKSSVIIYTDVNGPLISSFKVNLRYGISSLDKGVIFNGEFIDYKGIGENVLEIPFNENFKKENIYIIKFLFLSDNQILKSYERILITSEVFNNFKNKMIYDRDIRFDEWFDYYLKYRDDKFDINFTNDTSKREIIDINNFDNLKYWNGDKYNTFFPDDYLMPSYFVKKGYTNPKIGEIIHNFNTIEGDLWKYLNINNSLKYYDYLNEEWRTLSRGNDQAYRCILHEFLKATFEFEKVKMPFEFVNNLETWNYAEPLSKLLNNPNLDFSIVDNPVNIGINLYGRKFGNDDYEKHWDIYGSFRNNKYRHFFKSQVNNDKNLEIDYNNKSIITWLNSVLDETKAPCLLVNVTYNLEGTSANFKLFQLLLGTNNNTDFEFKKEENSKFYFSYIAFKSDKLPILIPLGKGKGNSYFDTFCKNISKVVKGDNWSKYDRFLLNTSEVKEVSPRLTIQHIQSINSWNYLNINLISSTSKKEALKNYNVKYDTILMQSESLNDIVNTIYDHTYKYDFNKEKFPYRTTPMQYLTPKEGLYELQGRITILNSKSKDEFDNWFNSPYYKEHRSNILGVYCNYETNSDPLIKAMSYTLEAHPYEGNTDDDFKKRQIAPQVQEYFKNEAKRAAWLVGHDWVDNIGRDSYIDLGGCWKGDSELVLTEKWPWLTQYEV